MINRTENELFTTFWIVADIHNKKLCITKHVIQNLKNLGSQEAAMYFAYKHRYPNYEEVIIPDFKPIPLAN